MTIALIDAPCHTHRAEFAHKSPQHGQGFYGFFYRALRWLGQVVTIVTFRRIVIVGAYHVLSYFFLGQPPGNGDTVMDGVAVVNTPGEARKGHAKTRLAEDRDISDTTAPR